MPKRKTKKSAGVTRKIVKTPVEVRTVVESGPTIEGMRTVWDEACKAFAKADDLAGLLDSIENAAGGIVESSDDTQAVKYAQMTLARLQNLRIVLKAGPAETIAMTALQLGEASEKLRIYLHGPYVVQVREKTRTLQAAHDKKCVAYSDSTKKNAVALFDKLRAEGMSVGAATERVAVEFDISPRSLFDWRKKFRQSL